MGDGSFDEFQARFDATMPASTPQDIRELANLAPLNSAMEAAR